MKVLVDTSVWIEYFRGNENYYEHCQYLIEQDEVCTVDFIFAELIQGARNNREIDILRCYYKWTPQISIQELIIIAGEYSQRNKLVIQGIGLIDACIITAAIQSKSILWTLDKKIVNFLHPSYLYAGLHP